MNHNGSAEGRMLPILPAEAETLPATSGVWLSSALPGPIPKERIATCQSCAMVKGAPENDTQSHGGQHAFRADLKCCTFSPMLSNFQVGAILADSSAISQHARQVVRDRIARRVGVSPLGITPLPGYSALYDLASSRVFGRSPDLRCEYYTSEILGGGCSIWNHRNSVCATWFCKHNRGKRGRDFWNAVRLFLHDAEESMALLCATRLGVGPQVLTALDERRDFRSTIAAQLDAPVASRGYAERWGEWVGREEEFFDQAWQVQSRTGYEDLLSAGGVRLSARLTDMNAAYQALLHNTIPRRIVTDGLSFRVVQTDIARIATYSPYDPLDVPKVLVDVLPFFAGGDIDDVRAHILADAGVELDDTILQKLLDYGILREVDEPRRASHE